MIKNPSYSFLLPTTLVVLVTTAATGRESAPRDSSPAAMGNAGDWCSPLNILEETRPWASPDRSLGLKEATVPVTPTLESGDSRHLLLKNPRLWYDNAKGLRLQSDRPHADLWLGFRYQWRTTNLPGDIRGVSSLQRPQGGEGDLDLRRGRVKGGGTLFSKNFTLYSEYNFPTETLLDFRATYAFTDNFRLRFGQWKSDFSRERVDSSGKQQLVERSISNYWFTVDRQLGTSLYFRFWKGKAFDSSVWIEYLTGRGRGAGYDGESGFWLGRWQWNPQGKELAFSQSDLKRSREFLSSVTLAAVQGHTPFTRFSSSGGRQLPGYGAADYRLSQLMFETAAHYRGWSWQQELHVKEVRNRSTAKEDTIFGGYAQLGTFPSEYCPWVPEPLEFVLRFAQVDPDTSLSGNTQREWTFGTNWYFDGHRNKLNADLSLLDIDDPANGDDSKVRFRLQWERSF